MDAKTLTALQGSIKKWEAIVAGTGVDRGIANCPLCEMFYNEGDDGCHGCPVSDKTSKTDCGGTPYNAYASLCNWERNLFGCESDAREPATTPEQKAAAQAELDFLKSLLP